MEHIAEEYANRMARISLLTLEEKKKSEEKYTNEIYGTGNVSDNIFSNIQKFQHEEYQYLNLYSLIAPNKKHRQVLH